MHANKLLIYRKEGGLCHIGNPDTPITIQYVQFRSNRVTAHAIHLYFIVSQQQWMLVCGGAWMLSALLFDPAALNEVTCSVPFAARERSVVKKCTDVYCSTELTVISTLCWSCSNIFL